MSDENFGSNFISISDDEGNNYNLEHLDTIEIDGVFYLAFLPADMDENNEDFGMVILKKDSENDEYLVLPDDDELDFVYEKFMERLFNDDEDLEDEDEDE